MASTKQQQPPAPASRESNEEPRPAAEESVPSDAKDKEGEKMMEELGRERAERGKSA